MLVCAPLRAAGHFLRVFGVGVIHQSGAAARGQGLEVVGSAAQLGQQLRQGGVQRLAFQYGFHGLGVAQ
ncbi:hypothetical protein D3C85_1862250 [compost metagenome]